MTIRLAINADAAAIAAAIQGDLGAAPALIQLQAMISNALDVVAFDTVSGAWCCIGNEGDHLEVKSLHPRSISRNVLGRVLAFTLRRALLKWPAMANTRIEATFHRGLDAQGRPDGGRELCLAWQAIFPGATLEQRGDEWYIRWTLKAARDAVQAL